MAAYDAVIFDNDGVLTEPTAREPRRWAIKWSLRQMGVDSPTQADIDSLFAVSADEVRRVADRYGLDPSELLERREMNTAAVQYGMLRNGRKPLYDDVDTFCDISIPIGIVSNNQHRTIEHIVDLFGLDKFVDSFYGRSPTLEGIEYRKPNPTYLQRAIVDLDARRPLYVGDSNGDIVAAERARIDSVFLRREHRSDYELTSDPTYEGTGLADVLSLIETEALTPVSKQ